MLETIKLIDTAKLVAHPDNPRKDMGDLSELKNSIREYGILQNLTIYPNEDNKTYTVLMGHRRLAAAKEVGFKKVPCRVVEAPERKEQITLMLCENMQRSGLTIPEEADGFQMVLDLGGTVKEITEKTGLSEGTVRNRLNVAKLDRNLIDGCRFQLTISDYLELQKVQDIEERNRILAEAYSHENLKWTVARTVQEAENKKRRAQHVEALKEMGFTFKTPDELKGKVWHTINGVTDSFAGEITAEKLGNIDPKDPRIFATADGYAGINIIELATKEETDKLAEKERKRREKQEREEEQKKKVYDEVLEFLKMAFEGKHISVKDASDAEAVETIRIAFIESGIPSVELSDLYNAINGGNKWTKVPEEKLEEFRPKAKKISAALYVLFCRFCSMPGYYMDRATFREAWRPFIDDMKARGFTLSEEARKIFE